MATYAVVDSTGKIVNRIVLDDAASWPTPEGHLIVQDTDSPMEIGGTYIDGVYTAPEPQQQTPMPPPA